MQNKSQRRPVIDPMLLALKSRRFIVALCALLVGVFTLVVPELAAVRAELLVLLITLALAVIGGYSIEDAARAARQQDTLAQADLKHLIHETVTAIIEEWLPSNEA